MNSNESCFADLNLVSPQSSILLSAFYPVDVPVPILYTDMYVSLFGNEFPTRIFECISAYLYPKQGLVTDASMDFFNSLSTNQVACRAIDETSEHVYFILSGSHLEIESFILLKIQITELYWYNIDMNQYAKSLISMRIQDAKYKLELAKWVECYSKYIQDWANYSTGQQKQIKGLNEDIVAVRNNRNLSEEQIEAKNINYGFGECIYCWDRFKNIVFLPCGHVVACLYCTIKNLKFELNKKISKKRLASTCPLCKGVIREAREVLS